MKVSILTKKEINITEIRMNLKLRDEFRCTLHDENGEVIKDYEGYVPNNIIPGEYGDYMELNIDIETGQILNWKKPTQKELMDFIDGEND